MPSILQLLHGVVNAAQLGWSFQITPSQFPSRNSDAQTVELFKFVEIGVLGRESLKLESDLALVEEDFENRLELLLMFVLLLAFFIFISSEEDWLGFLVERLGIGREGLQK